LNKSVVLQLRLKTFSTVSSFILGVIEVIFSNFLLVIWNFLPERTETW